MCTRRINYENEEMLFNLGTQFFEIDDKELLSELSKNKLLDHRVIKKYN